MIVLVLVLAQTAKAATAAIHASMLGNDIAGVGVVLHFSNGGVVQYPVLYPIMDIGQYWTDWNMCYSFVHATQNKRTGRCTEQADERNIIGQ
jgi:hypothetical protein